MDKYRVLINFTDDADKEATQGANIYWVGSEYPRDGYMPDAARIAFLTGKTNRFGKPVIVKEERKTEAKETAPRETVKAVEKEK